MVRTDSALDETDRVRRLRKLDCCAVSDALDRLKLGGVVNGVPRQSGQGRIAGRVVTLKLGIGQGPSGPPRHLGTAAIQSADADNVIVIEQHANASAGSWGGLLSLAAKTRGVAGVICDGPVRDIDEARALDFPIFTRTLTAQTARGRIVELGTNVPITFEKVAVHPGDYVIADSSAVIFIRSADIDRVLEAAEAIAAKEEAMANAIRAGEPVAQVMGASYEQMLKN